MQDREQLDWSWLTISRLRVRRELTEDRSEREAAETLGITHEGVRSIVEAIKDLAGLGSVRELRRWWRLRIRLVG